MKIHDLKTWPAPFAAILSGAKRYEIRKDDRGFVVGDELLLREWDPAEPVGKFKYGECGAYTNRTIRARVTYKTSGGEWGLPEGLCVLSIERIVKCSCTHEAGDTWPCDAHPGCSECGAETTENVKQCEECLRAHLDSGAGKGG